MRTIFSNLAADWTIYAIPLAVFIFSLISFFWLRRLALNWMQKWIVKNGWAKDNFLMHSVKNPSAVLCLSLSIYFGLAVSRLPDQWKNPVSNILWTLFVLALTLSLLSLVKSVSIFYGKKFNLPRHVILISRNIMRITVLVLMVLVVLDIWGVPTSLLLLLFAVVILIGILASRDSFPNLFASFQIASTQEFKVGDYIKLEGYEEGYISEISWNHTRLEAIDGSMVLIPNSTLIHRKVVNYGRPLKKARQPFRFKTRTHLAELSGLKATNLIEFVEILKTVQEPVIYYHSHHYLEEHQYLVPESTNDFATWVKSSLGNDELGERLANLSVIEYHDLLKFRDKMVNIIETYLAQDHPQRTTLPGDEFYFIKSVDVLLPTRYIARDLREFVEALRKITPSSLYFHIFESNLRSNIGSNDFSVWLANDMDELELSQEIARIDPYTFTLEGLRSLLIQTLEKHIK